MSADAKVVPVVGPRPSDQVEAARVEAQYNYLLSQYKYSQDYDMSHRSSILSSITTLTVFVLASVPLQFIELSVILGVPDKALAIVFLSLSLGLVITNSLITVFVNNSLLNDVNALRIEDELDCELKSRLTENNVGLWHAWYGASTDHVPDPDIGARYYGLNRGTAYTYLGAIFSFIASLGVAALLTNSVQTWSGSLELGLVIGIIVGAANFVGQSALMRMLRQGVSKEFRKTLEDYGFLLKSP